MTSLLTVEHLSVHYTLPGEGLFRRRPLTLKAVDDVSFELGAGETLGVVGETGCGKSSLGKGVLQLVRPAGGRVLWEGRDLCTLAPAELKRCRKDLQIIFQDPLSSLNPRMTIGEIVAEPLEVHFPALGRDERRHRVDAMLERVGLRPEMRNRYPNEFSGGQRQRISIARAMISEPKVIVCDEPVSSLDVSIQAQICNLLRDLQRDTGIALLFISHDLSIVRYMSHRVLVMYLGRVMESGRREEFFGAPRHPYRPRSAPCRPDPDRRPPSARWCSTASCLALDPPSGCVFRTRCSGRSVCITQAPPSARPRPARCGLPTPGLTL
jgi:oligopeptide transport system ATP-binding protein